MCHIYGKSVMMSERLCPTCRRTLSENAKFCTECGSRIDVQSTRKELEDYAVQESGLRIRRESTTTNPFYLKTNGLKEKILNPELKPLPEKKKVIFREWKMTTNDEVVSIIEEYEKDEEIQNEQVCEAKEELEEIQSEEICEAKEEAEELEEVQEIEETQEEPVIEELEVEESVIEVAAIEVAAIEKSEVVENVEELKEEAADFEALGVLFEEILLKPEEIQIEEVQEAEEELEEIQIEEEQVQEKSMEVEEIRKTEEKTEENNRKEELEYSRSEIQEIESTLDIQEIKELMKEEQINEIKANRIITTSISGGFKKKEPQVEEVKDVGKIIKKWSTRR